MGLIVWWPPGCQVVVVRMGTKEPQTVNPVCGLTGFMSNVRVADVEKRMLRNHKDVA